MTELPSYFDKLIQQIVFQIDQKANYWVIVAASSEGSSNPYVQGARRSENEIILECTSNRFLTTPITPAQHEALLASGWNIYSGEKRPNYWQIVELNQLSPFEIAKIMLKTFHYTYGVDNSYSYTIQSNHEFEKVADPSSEEKGEPEHE